MSKQERHFSFQCPAEKSSCAPSVDEPQPPVVSVIVPAYRVSAYICAALDSVLAQTFRDYEIIVINDGDPETEDLESVLGPYRDRIVYLKQENRGPAGARNTGIRTARGRLIALLDPDDMWEPEHLASQVSVLEHETAADAVYADARIFGDVPEAGRTIMDLSPSKGQVTFERLVTRACTVVTSTTVVRRDTVIRAGFFDESVRSSEDIDLWLRIVLQGGRIVYRSKVQARYRRCLGSLSSDPIRMLTNWIGVLQKVRQLPNVSEAQQQIVERQIAFEQASLHRYEGKRAFFQGNVEEAIAHLNEANRHLHERKLALVVMLLRIAPGFLKAAYQFRDRLIYRSDTRF